jgi:hypothetical protein
VKKRGGPQVRLEVAAWNLFRQGDLGFGQVVIDSRDNLDDLDHANGHGTDNPIDAAACVHFL